ncbi:helix-turn-helix domain-containing protein [Nocardia concava]|uniref:helix-turn-helix domain-containing protein n=1 Tax=Nocardia concava TaxID=257281 RepID=UPI0002E4059E|nr:helix-turn-helix transcriptional regulator [Nocardia concava]
MSTEPELAHAAWQIAIPTFGHALRRLRDDRAISRERLAYAAGVSASYVTLLEKGDRANPAAPVVDALVRCLDRLQPLTATERRYLLDLAGLSPSAAVPTTEELRAALTPDQLHALELHDPNPAAYLDVRANILAANNAWTEVLPGLSETGNLFHWLFGSPQARQVQTDWHSEARQYVQWLRAALGRTDTPTVYTDLIHSLAAYPEFRHMWSAHEVDFTPPTRTQSLRNPTTGQTREFYIQTAGLDCVEHPGAHIAALLLLEL